MGLLNDRRRVMSNPFPFDAEVEYLESSTSEGSTYIDTLIIPTNKDDIYIGITPTEEAATYRVWFTAQPKTGGAYYAVRKGINKDYVTLNYNSADLNFTTIKVNLTGKNNISLLSTGEAYLNDKKYDLPSQNSTDNSSSIKLFNRPGLDRQIYGKMYYFRVQREGVSIIDLVPVRKDGEGFFYDKVSGKLFGNEGKGRFITGPDVN